MDIEFLALNQESSSFVSSAYSLSVSVISLNATSEESESEFETESFSLLDLISETSPLRASMLFVFFGKLMLDYGCELIF